MDDDNNNELLTISGERITLSQLNTNLDTLTNSIYSIIDRESQALSNFSNTNTNIFQNLFHNPVIINNAISSLNWGNRNVNTIIQQSFSEKNKFKNILSKEGEELIVFDKFTPEKYKTIKCPITQGPFEINDSIAILPCKHVFDEESIMMWLNNENSVCPVCRYKLPHKEVKVNNNEESENVDLSGNNEPELQSDIEWTNNPIYEHSVNHVDISQNTNDLWNSFVMDIDNTLNDISNNETDNSNNTTNMTASIRNYNRYISNIQPGPQIPIMNRRPLENIFYRSLLSNLVRNNEDEEELQIQRAIIASLQEDISNNQTD